MDSGPTSGDWAAVENQFPKLDTGVISHREFHAAFLKAAQVAEQNAPLEQFWGLYFANHVSIQEVCDLMGEMRQGGAVVIAATNGDFLSPQHVTLQTRLRFDGVVNSWQIGVQKPNQRFFAACREKAAAALLSSWLDWGECLLIDYHPPYCEAFQRLGGRAIRFAADRDRPTLLWQVENLKRLLQGLGLLPMSKATIEEQSC